MKSKLSCFSRTIFFSQLKRFWPLYGVYFVTGLLLFILPLASTLRWDYNTGILDAMYVASWIMNAGFYGGLAMTAIFSAFFAMAAFHYLYNSRSVSQMGSIPVTRGGVFLSVYLPGLVVMLVSNLITFLLALSIASFYGLSIASYAFQAFAMSSLMALFFYGFAAFVAVLTGHILVLPLVYGVLNFTVVGVVGLTYVILEKFVYGLTLSSGIDSFMLTFSPVAYILSDTRIAPMYESIPDSTTAITSTMKVIGFSYDSWGYLIAIAVVGLAFTALALLLLKRRRMEAAGDVVAIAPLKPVFKYCMSFGCALIAGIGLYYIVFSERFYSVGAGIQDTVVLLVFMLIGAFVGYFVAQMLLSKSLKVFGGKNWRGFFFAALILTVLTAVSEFDILGFESKVPAAEKVESVSVYGFGPMNLLTDYEDIEALTDIHRSLVEHKAQHETSTLDIYRPNFYIDYFMKDGSLLRRRYYLNTEVTEDMTAILDFLNSPNLILARATPDIANLGAKNISEAHISSYDEALGYYNGEAITSEQAFELYTECILPDIRDGTMGFIDLGWIGDGFGVELMNCDINIYFFERIANGDYLDMGGFTFTPTDKSVRTIKWLEEHGFEVAPYSEGPYYQ